MYFEDDEIDEEIAEDNDPKRWAFYFNLFFDLIHPKYGYFVRLPFPGGIMNQPARTMSILVIIRKEYLKMLEEKNRK